MSQSVDRLKELLFKPESEAIEAMSQRIDAVFDRAGTTDRFQASVAAVLDGALRDAEVSRHEQVANAIAPLIVKTVKTEIRNSTDDLVEALYPATGRMVKAYVASAIKDLTEEINRRLETNPVMLRVNALLSGRSAGELAIANSQKLDIDDVLLIQRATGALIARWPESSSQGSQDHVLGGVLTAINEFTTEAFKAEGSALRQIDLGGARVYLRVSPNYLLAAKCSGSPPVAAENVFDDEFLKLLDNHQALLDAGSAHSGEAATPLLRDMAQHLTTRLRDLQTNKLPGGARPLPILAAVIGVPLAGWLAWNFYIDYRVERVRSITQTVIAANSELQGYPAEIDVTQKGRVVTISGLSPSPAAKASLMNQLRVALPGTEIHDQLNALAQGGAPDARPAIAELSRKQSAFEADLRTQAQARSVRIIERTEAMLTTAAAIPGRTDAGDLKVLAERLAGVRNDITQATGGADRAGAVKSAADELQLLAGELKSRALAGGAQPLESTIAPVEGDPAPDAGNALTDAAEQASLAAQTIVSLRAIRQRLADEELRFSAETERLTARIENEAAAQATEIARLKALIPASSPRQALEVYARSHAIFFSDQTTFRDEAAARSILDALAGLMKHDPSLLRVVGYTDDSGNPAKNAVLSKARAEIAANGLIARGIAVNRIVILGRTATESNVATTVGVRSPNRRVEFEPGFIGENAE